jgi:hypothetical protein
LTLVSLGATDLIASGDWTVPREGVVCEALFFRTMMLVPIVLVPADLEASYSKARFPRYFFIVLDYSGPPGLKNATWRLGEMGGLTRHLVKGKWERKRSESRTTGFG